MTSIESPYMMLLFKTIMDTITDADFEKPMKYLKADLSKTLNNY